MFEDDGNETRRGGGDGSGEMRAVSQGANQRVGGCKDVHQGGGREEPSLVLR